LAAKNISAFAMALNKKTGEQIDSLVTIAALRKASCTSSDATWSDVLAVAVKRFIVSAHTMIGLSRSHAQRPNQSMKPTAPWRDKFSVFATTPCRGLSLSR
jgi:hypothetical protein